MMRKKNNIIVGLTTFNTEMLRISIPALGKIKQKFMLVIYNDNPMENVSRREIRKLGYCGDLQIINTDKNIGQLNARFEIINAVREKNPDWIIFCDDDDILTEIDIPDVSEDTFAVLQNAVALRHRVADLIKVMESPDNFEIDGENVVLIRPHIGVAGTAIRGKLLFGLSKIISETTNEFHKLDEKLDFYPPADFIMWNLINIYVHSFKPDCAPIYMDRINYIKNDIDTACMKYGVLARPARNTAETYRRISAKYENILKNAIESAAAPRG